MIQPPTVHHSSAAVRGGRAKRDRPGTGLDALTQLSITMAAILGILFWTTLIVWLWENSAAPFGRNAI